MLDWFLETGFGYLLGVALIPGVGLLLVYRGLWGDRSKGRVRCPKCWYDMRGTVPRMECPECGHDAKQERRLHKHHRLWGRVVIGVVLVLLSGYPLLILGGWWREQAAIRRYQIVDDSITQKSIGPQWLVDRLPYEIGRFFERADDLYLSEPGKLGVCRSLPHLRTLAERSKQATDAELVHLIGLSNLESFVLQSRHVTDAGLVHLKGLSNLTSLSLVADQVTGESFMHLTQLKQLHLFYASFTDAGMVHLKGLSNLETLTLFGTSVTDAGLVHLRDMPNLVDLFAFGTPVTDAGVDELQQRLPNLFVDR